MKLYLVRHGNYSTDIKQQDVLNDSGKKEIEQIVNFIKPLQIRVSHCFHSEKMRAQQTAELLSQGLLSQHPIEVRQGLNPNDDVTLFANEIIHEEENVCIVGHLPFLSKLVSYLIIGNENKEIVFFHTGTMVCLEYDRTRWLIQWMWSPGEDANE